MIVILYSKLFKIIFIYLEKAKNIEKLIKDLKEATLSQNDIEEKNISLITEILDSLVKISRNATEGIVKINTLLIRNTMLNKPYITWTLIFSIFFLLRYVLN